MKLYMALSMLLFSCSLSCMGSEIKSPQASSKVNLRKISLSAQLAHAYAQALALHIFHEKAASLVKNLPKIDALPHESQEALTKFFASSVLSQDLKEKIAFTFVFHVLCSQESAKQKIGYLTFTEPYLSENQKRFVSFLKNNLLPVQNITTLTEPLTQELLLIEQEAGKWYSGKNATLLHCAAGLNNTEAIESLLPFYEDLDLHADDKSTALHYAALNSSLEAIQTLIKHGAETSLKTVESFNPLTLALLKKSSSGVQALLEHEDITNSSFIEEIIIQIILFNEDQALAQWLYNKLKTSGQLTKISPIIPLFLTIATHDPAFSDWYDPSVDWSTHSLADKLHHLTPLHIAAIFKNHNAALFFIKKGIDINTPQLQGLTPLHLAAMHNCLPLISLFIEHKADKEARGPNNITPLHIAIVRKNEEAVRLLLACGANKEAQNILGNDSLQIALISYHEPIVRLLLEQGIDIESANVNGNTALQIAVGVCPEQAVALLLERGAQLESTTYGRETPLHLAANRESAPIVKLLLKKGANVHAVDNYGDTPLLTAIKIGNADCAKLLSQAGAQLSNNEYSRLCIDLTQEQKEALKAAFMEQPLLNQAAFFQYALGLSNPLFPNSYEFLLLLLEANSQLANTPLYCGACLYLPSELAIIFKNEQGVKILLGKGALASAKSISVKDTSLLSLALSSNCSLNICQSLIDAGALVDEENNTLTALEMAFRVDYKDAIKLLDKEGKHIQHPLYKLVRAFFNEDMSSLEVLLNHVSNSLNRELTILECLGKLIKFFKEEMNSEFIGQLLSSICNKLDNMKNNTKDNSQT